MKYTAHRSRPLVCLMLCITLFTAAGMPAMAAVQTAALPVQDATDAPLQIVTMIFPGFDFARQVVGEHGQVSMLLPPGADSHSYEPSPKDILAIQSADLFIYTGGESDHWIDHILETLGEEAPLSLRMMDVVTVLAHEHTASMQTDHAHEQEHVQEHDHAAANEEAHPADDECTATHNASTCTDASHDHAAASGEEHPADDEEVTLHDAATLHNAATCIDASHDHAAANGEEHPADGEEVTLHDAVTLHNAATCTDASHDHSHEAELDEHVWTSPKNAILIVDAIADELCRIRPEAADDFLANAAAYTAQIRQVDLAFEQIVQNSQRKLIVFGDRFPLRYFTAEYGIAYDAAFPGCSEDSEPSVRTVISLVDTVRAEGVPVVFHIEYSSQKTARILAEETGAQLRLFHSCHSVSVAEIAAGATYVSLMQQNVEALKEALNGCL